MKRILLKMSGESLMGKQKTGIDPEMLNAFAKEIADVSQQKTQVAIVVGGGNIFRGLKGAAQGFDRVKGDQMGMMATVINSLALQSALQSMNVKARVYTAIRMEPVGNLYDRDEAIEAMENNEVVIVSGGTGNPFFTTDTAAALRAVELNADALLKATRVDGVYTADPEKDPKATRFDEITFAECLKNEYKILDLTAFTMCKENDMPIIVFNFHEQGSLNALISGKKVGTIVRN
ncbi:Uridylate kinase [Salinivirga cyanobacteriivorans]|uniref:Uridylate kinase n=1 Tax=Salinivirga cyanobacteriivorans TaxID=1307839 RepID=A0A0S2I0U8_9BACT|nr:UMP kinase [Salinivirga cyanobacteriivorans]ALO15967.1 Uridylate kinase [Salinivirga cyanobacteriivorans]